MSDPESRQTFSTFTSISSPGLPVFTSFPEGDPLVARLLKAARLTRLPMNNRRRVSLERTEQRRRDKNQQESSPNLTAFPSVASSSRIRSSGEDENYETNNSSRFRRITRIPSWVRGRAVGMHAAAEPPAPSSSRRTTSSTRRSIQIPPRSPIIR